MRKGAFIFILYLFFISCQEKTKEMQKTYEELEAEVLCDVLSEIIHEAIFFIPPPPPPPNLFLSQKQLDSVYGKNKYLTDYPEYFKFKKDSIKKLAQINNKITISIIDDLFLLEKQDININNDEFELDTLNSRNINKGELMKSSLKFEIKNFDSVSKKFYFEKNLALIRCSRVYFNRNKQLAYFEVVSHISPYPLNIVCEKKINKWIVKEMIKQ
ncbi:hypothetical protein [Flavobacterium sp.]|uniref:hypothetical protein n=1 Tax=Flavobacterium sp. TaxID=239 RepID=UPI004047A51B